MSFLFMMWTINSKIESLRESNRASHKSAAGKYSMMISILDQSSLLLSLKSHKQINSLRIESGLQVTILAKACAACLRITLCSCCNAVASACITSGDGWPNWPNARATLLPTIQLESLCKDVTNI